MLCRSIFHYHMNHLCVCIINTYISYRIINITFYIWLLNDYHLGGILSESILRGTPRVRQRRPECQTAGDEANDYEAFERAFALENEAYTAGNIHVICQEPWLMKQHMSKGVGERSIQKAGKKLDGEHVDDMKWLHEMLCCIRTAYMLVFQSLVKFHHKRSWMQHISQKPQKMVHQQTRVNCFSRAEWG